MPVLPSGAGQTISKCPKSVPARTIDKKCEAPLLSKPQSWSQDKAISDELSSLSHICIKTKCVFRQRFVNLTFGVREKTAGSEAGIKTAC
eukprot:6202222-Pleurochrysis_carterae.AAC.6